MNRSSWATSSAILSKARKNSITRKEFKEELFFIAPLTPTQTLMRSPNWPRIFLDRSIDCIVAHLLTLFMTIFWPQIQVNFRRRHSTNFRNRLTTYWIATRRICLTVLHAFTHTY